MVALRHLHRLCAVLSIVGFGARWLGVMAGQAWTQRRLAKSLKPGGRLCSSVWVRPEENPWTTVAMQAIAAETAEDAAFLIDMGIDCLQGYYFGAPTIVPPWKSPNTAAKRN